MARNVTNREIAEARARGAQMRAAGLAATSVRYDAARRRIVLELTNGNLFGVPVSSLANIAGATDADLATVELLGENIIHLESLDADYSVAGLVMNAFGSIAAARTLGRTGGSVTSPAKAQAARANGASGGRPKKTRPVTFLVNPPPGAKPLGVRQPPVKYGAKKAAKRAPKRKK
jgi:hypothetical protein